MTPPGLSPLRLPVRTESGHALGSVVDVTIDPDTQTVIVYHVKPNRLVPDVVWSPLLIHRSQVVELSAAGLIVDDAVSRSASRAPAPQPSR
ncbi:MAG: PRC-barrel domain-containing protein [Patescibacteria group bacterium]